MFEDVDSSVASDHPLRALFDYFYQLGSDAYNPGVIVVELLLIGAVVHITLRFLQGTRGARLMRGIGVVVVSSFVIVRILAERFHWERVEFLYQYFVIAVFLATLVIFQPELRRGFMRIGERLWFSNMYRKANKAIDPLVLAVNSLSKKRIGAIIAIERGTGLAAIIETGVTVDARLSAELLNTIFWPGTALHDMGVVLREDRIIAAGCHFPLAEVGELDRSMGSRHRAALGLSAESDCVVLVVSEETGTISLAYRGGLQRSLSPETLRDKLGELLAKPNRQPTDGTDLGTQVATDSTPPAAASTISEQSCSD